MGNLGQAQAYIKIYDKCTGIISSPNRQAFDLCGEELKYKVLNSKELEANNVFFISDADNVFLTQKMYRTEFDNYMKIGEDANNISENKSQRKVPRLEWTATNIRETLSTNAFWFKKLKLDKYGNSSVVLPQWVTVSETKTKNISKETAAATPTPTPTPTPEPEETPAASAINNEEKVHKIQQKNADPNIWWGVETNLKFMGIPYYIDISRPKALTKEGSELPTFVLIRINRKDYSAPLQPQLDSQTIDLLLQDSKIYLADWSDLVDYDKDMKPISKAANAPAEKGTPPAPPPEVYVKGPTMFDTSLTYSSNVNELVTIGIVPCMGKLIVFSGDKYWIYNKFIHRKVDEKKTGGVKTEELLNETVTELAPFILKSNLLTIYGSNGQVTTAVSAMEFMTAKCSPEVYAAVQYGSNAQITTWDIPNFEPVSSSTTQADDDILTLDWYYLFRGNPGEVNTGVSCKMWNNEELQTDHITNCMKYIDTGNTEDTIFGGGNVNVDFVGSTQKVNSNVMSITLESTVFDMYDEFSSEDGGFILTNEEEGDTTIQFPFKSSPCLIYRLRGVFEGSGPVSDPTDLSDGGIYDVISMSERFEGEENAIAHSIDVTLYYTDKLKPPISKIDLENKSYGIEAFLTWIDPLNPETNTIPFFTGVTLDVSYSEIAGKETITIHCEDYMRVLSDNLIINSPFYDGFDWFYAIRDMAKRAGIANVVDDTYVSGQDRYYLPSGYSFQEPRMKFQGSQNIRDCMMDVTKLCERVFYFDNYGTLRCKHIQGGLFFETDASDANEVHFHFKRMAEEETTGVDWENIDECIILDEKKVEKLIGSTVNRILVTSIDIATGLPIMVSYGISNFNAERNMDVPMVPPYNKVLFWEQNAFGKIEVVATAIAWLSERVFRVPSRVSFKTVLSGKPYITGSKESPRTAIDVQPYNYIYVDYMKYRTTGLNRSYNADDNSITTTITALWMGSPESQAYKAS